MCIKCFSSAVGFLVLALCCHLCLYLHGERILRGLRFLREWNLLSAVRGAGCLAELLQDPSIPGTGECCSSPAACAVLLHQLQHQHLCQGLPGRGCQLPSRLCHAGLARGSRGGAALSSEAAGRKPSSVQLVLPGQPLIPRDTRGFTAFSALGCAEEAGNMQGCAPWP